jgi:hypothetical protein
MATSMLSHQLGQMVDKREHADIEFLVGAEQTPVYASRLILVARSPVFAAQFMGGFKEALAPSLPSSSSSSPPAPDDSREASSLPPLFWRSAPLLEVEPFVFRRLLHCCYTDQLPPSKQGHHNVRDLVSLYAAADRFLLEHCKELVCQELVKLINLANVLTEFDHVLAVAPGLANSDAFQHVICANAPQLLGNTDSYAEAQWLAMSTEGAAAVVACNLSGMREVDLFRAVERWYRHLADEEKEDMEEDKQEDDQVEKILIEAKEQRVARVLEGMQYLLMSADEVRDVVEKSGLLSDKKLLAVYRESALYHRMVLPCTLREVTSSGVTLFDRVTIQESRMAWYAKLGVKDGRYVIYVYNLPQEKHQAPPSGKLSWGGISVKLYLDRTCHARQFGDGDKRKVAGGYGRYMCKLTQSTPKHVLVLVHVPVFGFGPA